MHVRIALLLSTLCRGQYRSQLDIDDRALAQDQTLLTQLFVDQRKEVRGQANAFEQSMKLQQRGRIWRFFFDQINTHETS
jgi:hypothetical protein